MRLVSIAYSPVLSFFLSTSVALNACTVVQHTDTRLGHRVATQYLLAALEGTLPAEHLLHYREANSKLPGHPELGLTPGVKFSSGRLGHMWCVHQ
jgi:transketolase N-terminal domain/subunit